MAVSRYERAKDGEEISPPGKKQERACVVINMIQKGKKRLGGKERSSPKEGKKRKPGTTKIRQRVKSIRGGYGELDDALVCNERQRHLHQHACEGPPLEHPQWHAHKHFMEKCREQKNGDGSLLGHTRNDKISVKKVWALVCICAYLSAGDVKRTVSAMERILRSKYRGKEHNDRKMSINIGIERDGKWEGKKWRGQRQERERNK